MSPKPPAWNPAAEPTGQPCKILLSAKCTTDNAAECRRILEAVVLPGGAKLSVSWWGRV